MSNGNPARDGLPVRRGVPRSLLAAVVFALFAGAIVVLHHTLHAYRPHDIFRALRAIPADRIAAALLLTSLNYLVLTGYDALGVRYLGVTLSYARIALVSFISYAFANNTGSLSILAGSGIRYRFYAAWGVEPPRIARLIAFTTLSFWLGFLALAGALFLLSPFPLPAALHLPFGTTQPLGVVFVLVAGAYLLTNAVRRAPLRIRDLELALPGFGLSAAQIALSMADWTLAAWILRQLLPPEPGPAFPVFLGYFLLAQIAGLASNVPGGLGVFETVMLLLLTPPLHPAMVFGALLAYRGIYYLLPLALAGAALGLREALAAREVVQRAARAIGSIVPGLVPDALAISAFVGGTILLFSGSLPAESGRFAWLQDFLPLPVLEFSHLLGSLAGAALLLLARGLQRRLDAAWLLTSCLLATGVVVSLLKGLDYEEAFVLALMLLALLPSRRRFYRRASLLSEPFSAWWVVSAGAVVVASAWLVLFSYKHVEYSNALWWQFALGGHAPRSLRALVGAVTILLVVAAQRLLHPLRFRPDLPSPADLDRAEALARATPRTGAYLALLGDKALLFSPNREAFLMFRIQGRSWIAMGDPAGAEEEMPELLWEFRSLSDRYSGRPVFYEVSRDYLPLYLDLGLTPLKIGEEAHVPLEAFTLEGGANKGLRHAHHRLAKEGCRFEVVPREGVPAILGELRAVSEGWLAEHRTREKRFSLGWFNEDYLRRLPVATVRHEGTMVAFANLWPGGGNVELSADLMRHTASAPPGVMDYLFAEIFLWGRAAGYHRFNFGMAPLSGLEDRALAPLWNKVGSFIFAHGEQLYNFSGLRAYKDKFHPVWEPSYLAIPGGLALPLVLADLATLISGGARGIVAK